MSETSPLSQVDIIISEWMGYFLLYESMLDTVLWARDRYLDPEHGLIFPDVCSMSMVAVEDPAGHQAQCGYWSDVYGFKMTCMRALVVREAGVEVVRADTVVSAPCVIKVL